MAVKRKKKKNIFSEVKNSKILYWILILFIGMCWAFVLGLIIGRGYKVENIMSKEVMVEKKTNTTNIIPPEKLVFLDKLQEVKNNLNPPKIENKKEKLPKKNKLSLKKNTFTYEYTYQCAAYRNKQEAINELHRLKRIILKACTTKCFVNLEKAIINKQKWYRILIKIKCNKESTPLKILQKSKIKNYFLKQKIKIN